MRGVGDGELRTGKHSWHSAIFLPLNFSVSLLPGIDDGIMNDIANVES